MFEQGPSLYRESALKQYMQRREKEVLPRVLAPPALLICWLVLGLFLLGGLSLWIVRVPIYATGTGLLLGKARPNQASVVLFFPASARAVLRADQPVQFSAPVAGLSGSQRVAVVEPGVLSPFQASQRYGLSGELTLLVQQPVVVVLVELQPGFPFSQYQGTVVQARVQVGEQRLADLLSLSGNGRGEQ